MIGCFFVVLWVLFFFGGVWWGRLAWLGCFCVVFFGFWGGFVGYFLVFRFGLVFVFCLFLCFQALI